MDEKQSMDYKYKHTFEETEFGKEIIDDLKRYCDYDGVLYNQTDRDTNFCLGARSTVCYILSRIKQAFEEKLQENANDEESEDE